MARKGQITGGAVTAVAAGTAGAAVADQGWVETAVQGFVSVLDKHGLATAIAAVLMLATLWLVRMLLNATLGGKDAEISRLVAEKERLYDEVLKKRKSSQGTKR